MSKFFCSGLLRENEIRTGMFLLYRKEIVKVLPDNISTILFHIHDYRAMPLDKDILKLSGYRQDGNSQKFYNKRFDYYFIFSGKIGIMQKYNGGSVGVPIRYVHELQNTYYFLTGEELILELPAKNITDVR